MVAQTNEEKRVAELFPKVPADRRPYVMLAIAGSDPRRWKRYQTPGEERLRTVARERGLNWDAMNDEQRQEFLSDPLREDRP